MSHIPPATAATIALLQARGHSVTVRVTRGNSNRYRLDDERERTALDLSNRYDRLYGSRLNPTVSATLNAEFTT